MPKLATLDRSSYMGVQQLPAVRLTIPGPDMDCEVVVSQDYAETLADDIYKALGIHFMEEI